MNDDINQEQTNENINDLLTTSMNNLNFDDEAEYGISIGILEYAYSLKHHRFQNLIEAYEQALTNQLNNDNKSILSFEIISKTEIDGKAVDPVVLSVQSEEISSKISELITILKKPEGYQSKGEAWQMVVDIPYGFTADNIESAINADAVFCYLLASSWVNNYSNDSKTFLFSRTNLKAGLRIDSESQSCQILLIFYDKNEPQDDSNKNLEETKQNENKQGGGFMKSPNRSIRKSAKDLNVPRKYDNMRQSPQEVPLDVIKKLFLTIDQDIDDRISAEEIKNYIRKVKLTIEESVADELFHECADRRVVVHQKQKLLPLTFDEVVAAIRGRYSWNMVEKKWDVSYRPMRTYWIILLKTISEKVFAIPVPQIKPTKILAQFELNEIMMRKRNMEKQAGTIKRYHSIADVNVPTYQRVENKPGSEYLMNFITRVLPEPEFNPYEYQINRRVKPTSDDDGNANPKIGWEARAFFEQSLSITKKDPTWTSPDKNPIMYYIPARQLPDSAYLPKAAFAQTPQQTGNPGRSAEGFNLVDAEGKLRNIGGKLNNRSKRSEKSMPSTPFEGEEHSVKTFSRNPTKSIENTVNGDEPSNVLFGPNGTLRNFTKSQVALTEFKKKQILKGNKRAEVAGLQNPEPSKKQYGFRTRFILNDLFTDKAMRARNARNMMSEDIKEHFVADEFAPFKDPVFRDLDLPFGKKEINLLYRCSMAENPFNMSAMNTQPRMVQNKEVKEREALEARRKDEYEKALQGDKPRIKDLTWTQYHHVPEKLKPISHGLKDYYLGDKKFKAHDKPFLPKDKFGDDTTLLVLARQMRDGEILGKPNLNLYFKPTKARDDDIDVEFGRVQKKYKTIY